MKGIVKVTFTKHAIQKFSDLEAVGVKISRKDVSITVKKPENLDQESDFPKIIASRSLNVKQVLRVVFKIESDKIIIITFYPARKGRYYEKKTN